ncbi:hypothetical protein [Pistricoccus aurantiacus]|nr:hypothetical protein [Pistricoccus aurantiacus]
MKKTTDVHVIAMQVGDKGVEVIKDVSNDECMRLVTKIDPTIAKNL